MPSRIIKESCTRSATLDALSAEAERLFWRLTTVADDYGRLDAHATVVRTSCFKRREDIRTAQVERWLRELATGADPALQLYTVEGRRYGVFRKWHIHQRTRQGRSRFPDPPPFAATCGNSPQSAVLNVNVNVNENVNVKEPKETHTPAAGLRPAERLFDRFWAAYPKKRSKGQAERTWMTSLPKLLGHPPTEPFLASLMVALERAKTSEEWTRENGRYIPYPASWLNAKGWEDEPVGPPKSAALAAFEQAVRDGA